MRIVLDTGDGERELVAAVGDRSGTVAELLRAAGVGVPAVVTVDGRAVPTDHSLAEAAIVDGATVATERLPVDPSRFDAAGGPGLRLTVVAGVGAGRSIALRRAVVVGRDDACDLSVAASTLAPRHCRFAVGEHGEVHLTDLDALTGTWVDGEPVPPGRGRVVGPGSIVRCGAVALRLEEAGGDDRPRSLDPLRHITAAGTVPFNRPPRPAGPAQAPTVGPLPDPPVSGRGTRVPLAAILAPVAMGLVTVVLFQDLRYALFLLLSPVMVVANAVADRRRTTSDRRGRWRLHRDAVTRFVEEVTASGRAEVARRWELTPSVAEVVRRGLTPSTRLWERRPWHEDALLLTAGVGAVPFEPTVEARDGGSVAAGRLAREILAAAERLHDAPVDVPLAAGGVVGVVGDRTAALALARSLVVQAAVHHGPADLAVAVVVAAGGAGEWGWVSWLPHTVGDRPDGPRRLAVGDVDGESMLRELLDAAQARTTVADGAVAPPGEGPRTTLLVLDASGALRGRGAPARAVLRGEAGPVAGIVLAPTLEELPAVCDTIVSCGSADGDAVLVRPGARLRVPDLLVAGLDEGTARDVARRLAGIEDPELGEGAGRLPTRVDLRTLLTAPLPPEDLPTAGRAAAVRGDPAGGGLDAGAIAATWVRTAGSPGLVVPIGVDEDGPVTIDLGRDGPHGLLGGTTGSGKSELLRSLVAGAAARYDPDHLTFVLIDYKGGAAFDACAGLPHVVGLVTDLDEHLGERALRCLEAELAHRERRLRQVGVSDLPAWLRLPRESRGAPLPRLVVVIDEFATLKAELPAFVDALVGIAQRGRSLGVHLVLGTQRPSGAVDENVRANCNLRIALRVTDARDSTDVIGVPDAASIPPSLPGRAVVRVGPGAVLELQTALVTGRSRGAADDVVRVAPMSVGRAGTAASLRGAEQVAARDDDERGPTDLERLVAAAAEAFAASGASRPRRPWPEPLPERLSRAELRTLADRGQDGPGRVGVGGRRGTVVEVALADVPEQQARVPAGWDLAAGPLLVHGVVGSGSSTTLATAVLEACRRWSPDDLHVHVLDMGRGELAPLGGLPHVGAVVTGREHERRRRVAELWLAAAERRRAASSSELSALPWLVVAIDGLDLLLDELDDPTGFETAEGLLRMFAESASLRIAPVLVAARAAGVRSQLLAAVEQRWTHRLAVPDEYAVLGLRPGDVPTLVPGRAVRVGDGRVVQVVHPGDLARAVEEVAATWPGSPVDPAPPVRVLPSRVDVPELAPAVVVGSRGAWTLPVGRRDRDLGIVGLPLHAGEHAVVLGSPGSGRSGLLGAVARAVARAGIEVVTAAGTASSPLLADGHEVVGPGALAARLARGPTRGAAMLAVLDDAERIGDPGAVLESLARDGPRVHLLVAARDASVEAEYGHWVRRAARSGVGVLLRPVEGASGDLLRARLPRRPPCAVTSGRGWVVTPGSVDFAQFAVIDGHRARGDA